MTDTSDINRRIAEKLGYRIESVPYEGEWVTNTDNYRHFLITPDNRRLQYSSPGAAYKTLPDWQHSVDAALKLPIPDNSWWQLIELGYSLGTWEASLHKEYDKNTNEFILGIAEVKNLAEAICLAWLDYQENKS